MRILMLEDDDSIRECLREIICNTSEGRICDSTAEVDEAIELMRSKKYDAILADLMIRGQACENFVTLAKEIQPHAKLCIMSAMNGADKIATKHRVDCFISKPFSLEILDDLFLGK